MNSNRVPFRSLLHTFANLPSSSSRDDDHIFRHPQQPQPKPKKQQQPNHLKVSATLSRLVRVLKDNPYHNKVRLFKVCASEAEGELYLVDGSIVRESAKGKWQADYCRNIDAVVGKDKMLAFVFLKVDDLFYSAKPKWVMIYCCPDGVDPTNPTSNIKFLCSLEHNQQTLRCLFDRSLFGVLKAINPLQLRLDYLLIWMARQERHDILCIEANAKLWPPPIPLGTDFHIPQPRESTTKQGKKRNSAQMEHENKPSYVVRVQLDIDKDIDHQCECNQ